MVRRKFDYFSPRHQFLYLVVLLRLKLIGRNGGKFCEIAHVHQGPMLPDGRSVDRSGRKAIFPRSAVAYRRLQGKRPILVSPQPLNNQTIRVERPWVFGIICNLVDARLRLVDAQSTKFFDELDQTGS